MKTISAKTIISRKLKIEPSSIQPELTLSDLGADEIDQMEIIMNIERYYNFRLIFPESFHAKSIRIKDIFEFISEQLKSKTN